MIEIIYKNRNKEDRKLIYNENNLAEMWYDIAELLNNSAEILGVYKHKIK